MRLFLFGLWFVTLAACKSEDRREGAVRVDLSYATFRPGCLTLTASDKADPSRSTVQVLSAPETADGRVPRSRELTVAVYRQDNWSRDLVVTAEASESDCAVEDRKSVATQSVDAQVPEEGIVVVRLDLRATDLDDDGFVRTDEGGTDCDDANPAVKPGVVGLACTTAQNCEGTFSCTTEGGATACVSTQPFTTWYTDVDGDGQAGTPVGDDCKPPVEGAKDTQEDCDGDGSPFAFTGAEERCDRVDNNCNGQVDENGCGAVSWKRITSAATPGSNWRAVAAHAGGQAWVAGDNGSLVHVKGTNASVVEDCPGDWLSAWARDSDGRVFLGSNLGVFASHDVQSPGCGGEAPVPSTQINGLVGFEDGMGTTLFAVKSGGLIYRWKYPETPTAIFDAGFTLRAIHGTRPSNMLAVGSQNGVPKAFRSNVDGSTWTSENLPTGLPPETTLTSVHVVHDELAYAAGENGVVLMKAKGIWTKLPDLPKGAETPNVRGLTAYGPTAVYVAVGDKTVRWFNGQEWSTDISESWTPNAMGGKRPDEVWVVGSQNTILRRGP